MLWVLCGQFRFSVPCRDGRGDCGSRDGLPYFAVGGLALPREERRQVAQFSFDFHRVVHRLGDFGADEFLEAATRWNERRRSKTPAADAGSNADEVKHPVEGAARCFRGRGM